MLIEQSLAYEEDRKTSSIRNTSESIVENQY